MTAVCKTQSATAAQLHFFCSITTSLPRKSLLTDTSQTTACSIALGTHKQLHIAKRYAVFWERRLHCRVIDVKSIGEHTMHSKPRGADFQRACSRATTLEAPSYSKGTQIHLCAQTDDTAQRQYAGITAGAAQRQNAGVE
jgi:hypothetical protein